MSTVLRRLLIRRGLRRNRPGDHSRSEHFRLLDQHAHFRPVLEAALALAVYLRTVFERDPARLESPDPVPIGSRDHDRSDPLSCFTETKWLIRSDTEWRFLPPLHGGRERHSVLRSVLTRAPRRRGGR